jgi:hypothetical protein
LKPNIVSFWHKFPLQPLEQMCLASFVKQGFRATVYSYAPLQGLPPNIENADAEPILPIEAFYKLKHLRQPPNSNWNLIHIADLFRIRAQRLGLGMWLDTDTFLIRPFEIDPARSFLAWESQKYLGTGALYLPRDHVIVQDFENVHRSKDLLPDWLSLKLRLRRMRWNLTGVRHSPCDLSVVMYSTLAMTQLARRHDCLGELVDSNSFYTHSLRFFDPCNVDAVVNDPRVYGIHIKRKRRAKEPPIPGSLYEWALRNVAGLY